MKKILSLLFCFVLTFGVIAVGFSFASAQTCSKDDIIEYGSYPQSLVTDEDLIDALSSKPFTWKSFGYYSGTGNTSDGKMAPGNYMRYFDMNYKGEKYRAVIFDSYRPYNTGLKTSSTVSTYQDDNGYECEKIYWFRFEPLKWRVLDPSTQFIICESIIDSQPFNNMCVKKNEEFFSDKDCTHYANDYIYSSLRSWLNDDFYGTAFSSEEKANIQISKLDDLKITDRIFILSASGSQSYKYWNDIPSKAAVGTDYAKCQGLCVKDGYSYWRLRSASSEDTSYTYHIDPEGDLYQFCQSFNTYNGIRPAMILLSGIESVKVTPTDSPKPTVKPSTPTDSGNATRTDEPTTEPSTQPEKKMKAANIIKRNPLTKKAEFPYKAAVTFIAIVPDGGSVEWFVDGESRGTGDRVRVEARTEGYKIKAVATDSEGNLTYDTEDVTIKNSFFQKLIWFFKHIIFPSSYEIEQ